MTSRTSMPTSTCPTRTWRGSRDRARTSKGQRMIVLGLDPGTRHFGWGLVRKVGTRLLHIAHGVLDVEREGDLGERLVAIEKELNAIVAQYSPDQASIESLFLHRDGQAAADVGHARG